MKFLKIVLFILVFVFAFNLSACSSKLANNSSADNSEEDKTASGDYVGTIAGEKINVPEFKFYLGISKNDMLTQAGVNAEDKNAVKAFWESKSDNGTNADAVKNKSLDLIKELKILLIKAKEDKVQLDNNDLKNVKSFIDSAIQEEGGGDKAKAEDKIKETLGINLSQYESIYKDYLLAYTKYGNASVDKVEISDKEIRDYYDKNLQNYDKVTVKHILLLTQDNTTGQALTADKVAEKKKLAEDILNKAKSGTDFDSLVTQYSEDPGSKDSGGEYTFGKGEMVKEFEDWSFNAKEGDIGLVTSSYGFHIIKFIKKLDFDSQKDTVKHDAQSDKFKQKLDEWKNDEKYKVQINKKVFDSIKVY